MNRFICYVLFCGLLFCAAVVHVAAQTINVPKPSQRKARPDSNPSNPRTVSDFQPTAAETKLKAVKALLPPAGGGNSSVQTGETVVLNAQNLKTPKGFLILKNVELLYPNSAIMKGASNQPGAVIVHLEKLPKGKYLLIFDVQFTAGSGTFYLVKPGDVYEEVNYPNGKQKIFFVVDVNGGFDIFRLEAEFNFAFHAVEAVHLKQ